MRTIQLAKLQFPRPSEGKSRCACAARMSSDMASRGAGCDFHLLLVTEVTRMTGGFYCVATWDVYEERIVRPLALDRGYWAFPHEQSRWRPGYLLEVAARCETTGHLPHRRENMVLRRYPRLLERWEEAELYQAVSKRAGSSILAEFRNPITENKFVPEGTDCPSLGSVRSRLDQLSFVDDGWGKLRLRFTDSDDQRYALPVTCDTLQKMFSPKDGMFGPAEANEWLQANEADAELILRLGFCRGYTGNEGKWWPPPMLSSTQWYYLPQRQLSHLRWTARISAIRK